MAAGVYAMRAAVQGFAQDVAAAASAVTASGRTLQQAAADAEHHVGRIQAAAADSEAAAARVSAASSDAQRAADDAATHGGRSLAGLEERAESAAAAVSSSSSRAAKAAEDAARTVSSAADEIETQEPRVSRMGELLQQLADRGDAQVESLITRLKDFGDEWSATIAEQLETVQIGAKDLQDFLTLWGDAVVETERGHERLRDLLDDLDPDVYVRQITEVVRALRDGQSSIDQVIDFLASRNSVYAKSLAELVQAVLAGKSTVEDLRRRAEQLEQLFPDAPISDLADELGRKIAEGLL